MKNLENSFSHSDSRKYHRGQEGVALLIVLWILILLMVIVMSFSYMIRTEVEAGLYFKERIRDDVIAEGAIQRAILEIMYSKRHPDAEGNWFFDRRINPFGLAGQEFEVKIVPESSQVDLNRAPNIILKGLLSTIGVEEQQDIIVDSLHDWRDADDLHRLNGAEDEYYMSLDRPYRCKNGELDSIEELLLIRSVTDEIFYGKEGRKGLRDFVTVFSNSTRINVNAADREVLLSIPGMSIEIVDAIIDSRAISPFKTTSEFQAIVGGAYTAMSSYITISEGNTYRITANRKGSRYGIQAIVQLAGNDFIVRSWKKPVDIVSEEDEEV